MNAGQSYAQSLTLPAPGIPVALSQAFQPVNLKGIKIDPVNPLRFDFIIDKGTSFTPGMKEVDYRLIKYFLAALTVPEKDLWVNLSPYEKDRIIPDAFGLTEMGRDLLGQDYILKQITSSLMNPDDNTGRSFWKRVYEEAYRKYGTTDIPVDTFNKVWIVPQEARVYEHNGAAFVVKARLKVMFETDYLAMRVARAGEGSQSSQQEAPRQESSTQDISRQIIREVILPILETEVNEGRNFSRLRQIYNAMILSTWFKVSLKQSLVGQVYADRNKVKGIDIDDKDAKLKIYDQYLAAFRKGVVNIIREEKDTVSDEVIPRKYFSGGYSATGADGTRLSELVGRDKVNSRDRLSSSDLASLTEGDYSEVTVDLSGDHRGAAVSRPDMAAQSSGHLTGQGRVHFKDPVYLNEASSFANDKRSFLDRHYMQWQWLQQKAMPYLIRRALGRAQEAKARPRLVVADLGASTAEEMARIFYEVTMALEVSGQVLNDWDLQVNGFEIDPQIVAEGNKRIGGRQPFFRARSKEEQIMIDGRYYADRIIERLNQYAEKFQASARLLKQDILTIPSGDLADADLVVLNHVLRIFKEEDRGALVKNLSLDSSHAILAVGDSLLAGEAWKSRAGEHIFVESEGSSGGTRYSFGLPEEALDEIDLSQASGSSDRAEAGPLPLKRQLAVETYLKLRNDPDPGKVRIRDRYVIDLLSAAFKSPRLFGQLSGYLYARLNVTTSDQDKKDLVQILAWMGDQGLPKFLGTFGEGAWDLSFDAARYIDNGLTIEEELKAVAPLDIRVDLSWMSKGVFQDERLVYESSREDFLDNDVRVKVMIRRDAKGRRIIEKRFTVDGERVTKDTLEMEQKWIQDYLALKWFKKLGFRVPDVVLVREEGALLLREVFIEGAQTIEEAYPQRDGDIPSFVKKQLIPFGLAGVAALSYDMHPGNYLLSGLDKARGTGDVIGIDMEHSFAPWPGKDAEDAVYDMLKGPFGRGDGNVEEMLGLMGFKDLRHGFGLSRQDQDTYYQLRRLATRIARFSDEEMIEMAKEAFSHWGGKKDGPVVRKLINDWLKAKGAVGDFFMVPPVQADPAMSQFKGLINPQTPDFSRMIKLGNGGQGDVYQDPDDPSVFYKEARADPREIRSTKRSAVYLRQFNRVERVSGIPELLEVGGDGRSGFWMKLRGIPQGVSLDKAPLFWFAMPIRQKIDIVTQIIRILERLHGLGLVHNDIKPANIVVNKGGEVMLIDYGETNRIRKNRRGFSQGYSSEEDQGSVVSDIYSLGRTMAYILSEHDASDPVFEALDPEVDRLVKRMTMWQAAQRSPRTMEGVREELKKIAGRVADLERSGVSDVGGIDLTAGRTGLQILRDGNGALIAMSPQTIQNIDIEGFYPVIINIVPVISMKALLGLSISP